MRYIGNKTRLLRFIAQVLKRRRIAAGRAVDPFSGTASVGRELKRLGFVVHAADIMEYGYVFARAYVEVRARPRAHELAARLGLRSDSLDAVIAYLNALPPQPGFIHGHYTPAGAEGGTHGRMYFTPDNGARIDAVRSTIHEWHANGWIDDDIRHTLIASLLEAADRVANTTGVYAAFVKSWQPNALRPLALRTPEIVEGDGCTSMRCDALDTVTSAGAFDLLYLDPPYNTRQYAGYYHIPELIAEGWFTEEVVTRGKTGLLQDDNKRSDWSRSRKCETAFEALVASARCRQIVMSYNAEGIIPAGTIERVLKRYGRRSTYRRYACRYRRYRSDSDGERRRYRGDSVTEYLHCISR
jgi:adenine-specific DNA-methyltransferase